MVVPTGVRRGFVHIRVFAARRIAESYIGNGAAVLARRASLSLSQPPLGILHGDAVHRSRIVEEIAIGNGVGAPVSLARHSMKSIVREANRVAIRIVCFY